MIRNYLPRIRLFPLFVALLVILTVTLATAKQPPLQIHGTTWETHGKAKAEVKSGNGKTKTKGPMWVDIYFGAQGGLSSNQYLAVLDDGEVEIEVRGTFKVPPGKKFNTVKLKVFKKVLTEELEDLMDAMNPGYTFKVSVKTAKGEAYFKNKKSSASIKFKFATSWVAMEASVPGKVKSNLICLTKSKKK